MTDPIADALDALIHRYQIFWRENALPTIEFDPKWPSPCLGSEAQGGEYEWQPVLRQGCIDFEGVESALELTLHASVKTFFQRYYSWDLAADFDQHTIELVQVWNEADTERLLENIIGHLMMQRRLKQAETLFIATTEDEMAVVSVVNSTGEVVLETLGKGIDRTLAGSLTEFLDQLEPKAGE